MRRTLILSAWEPEIAWFRRWLLTAAGKPHARAIDLAAVGVGAVDAGIGAARAIAARPPTRVIFVGTAGFYKARSARFALNVPAVAERLSLVSTSVLRGEGYAPDLLVRELLTTPTLNAALLGASSHAVPVAVACPLVITQTPALARRIVRATRAGVENLEAFSVGRAAARADLPFAAVFGIANRVGPTAHAEWRENHRRASRAACELVWTWLVG